LLNLSLGEVADLLGVHPLTVRRAIALGQLPVIEVGRRKLVPRQAREQLLAAQPRTDKGREE